VSYDRVRAGVLSGVPVGQAPRLNTGQIVIDATGLYIQRGNHPSSLGLVLAELHSLGSRPFFEHQLASLNSLAQ
jgi:hypothetical protein